MPCFSDYREPTNQEKESVRVLQLLREVGFDIEYDSIYGRPDQLDEDTAKLCQWCKSHTNTELSGMSLEFQIWWRDHQIADLKHEHLISLRQQMEHAKQSALDKLTSEERSALGV